MGGSKSKQGGYGEGEEDQDGSDGFHYDKP